MTRYNVVFSDLAITDLSVIVRYITVKESYERAKYVERNLMKMAKDLEIFPNGYAKDEYASTFNHTVRFIVKWNYKLVYTVNEKTVYIVGIFHSSQNPCKLSDLL